MLKDTIQDELKKAMLARDELKTSVLRMLKSAINYHEINKGGAGYSATDEEVLAVIEKEAKQRRDSIEQYSLAGREDLVEKEKAELNILLTYLPKQLSDVEINNLIDEVIQKTGAQNMKDIGKIMGLLMPKVKGKADGNLINRLVRERLQSS